MKNFSDQKKAELFNKAIALIQTVLKVELKEILYFNLIYDGRSSVVYAFNLLNDQSETKYYLRFNLSKKNHSWVNEYYYLKQTNQIQDYFYYDIQTGDYLKKGVSGVNPRFYQNEVKFWKQFVKDLIALQKTNNLSRQYIFYNAYKKYKNLQKHLSLEDNQLFEAIGKMNETLPVVLAHNGLDFKNLIYDQKQVYFIDYEWIGWNNPYADLAALFFSEQIEQKMIKKVLQLYNKQSYHQLNYKTMQKMLFFAACLSYLWAISQLRFNKDDLKILIYKDFCAQKMEFYKNEFNLVEKLKKEER